MGQMHVQRAIELKDGPRRIIATDLNTARLDALRESFAPLAAANGKELIFFNPTESKEPLRDFVLRHTDGRGADDVIVSVPVASVMAEAATLMNRRWHVGVLRGRAQRHPRPARHEPDLLAQRAVYGHVGFARVRSGVGHR